MMLAAEEVAAQEELLREEISALEGDERRRYYAEFERRAKDPDTFATLNFIFITGMHHFYLGQMLRGAINLLCFFVAIWTMIFHSISMGLLILLAVTLTEIYALFRSQVIVQEHNNKISREVLDGLK